MKKLKINIKNSPDQDRQTRHILFQTCVTFFYRKNTLFLSFSFAYKEDIGGRKSPPPPQQPSENLKNEVDV